MNIVQIFAENIFASSDQLLAEEFRVAGDGVELDSYQPQQQHVAHLCASSLPTTASGVHCVPEASSSSSSSSSSLSAAKASKLNVAAAREKNNKGVKSATLIGSVTSEITTSRTKGVAAKGNATATASLPADIHPVDPETQARLEALLEAAGIGKLTGETKQLTDPEVNSLKFFPLSYISGH